MDAVPSQQSIPRCPHCGTRATIVHLTKGEQCWLFRASYTGGRWIDTGYPMSATLAEVKRFFEEADSGMYTVVGARGKQ